MKKPLVSVIMITYGHENYIEQAVNGVLMQECNFDVELIITNDCSPDETDAVIKNILKSHPKSSWIKYIKHEKNIGAMPNVVFSLKEAQGKYIAFCEGDDYWTDAMKLQKQVDIMQNKPEISLVFSNRLIYDVEKNSTIKHIMPYKRNVFSLNDVVGGFVPSTQTMLFRRDEKLLDFIQKYIKHPSGDQIISLFYAMKGNLYLLQDITATYRITGEGVWSSRRNNHEHSIRLFLNNFREILIKENVYKKFYFNSGLGRKILVAKSIKGIMELNIDRTFFFKLYCIILFRLNGVTKLIFQR